MKYERIHRKIYLEMAMIIVTLNYSRIMMMMNNYMVMVSIIVVIV